MCSTHPISILSILSLLEPPPLPASLASPAVPAPAPAVPAPLPTRWSIAALDMPGTELAPEIAQTWCSFAKESSAPAISHTKPRASAMSM